MTGSRFDPVVVRLQGQTYSFDRARCRRAFLLLQVGEEVGTMAALAAEVGVSRSTLSRFFSTGVVNPVVIGRILRRPDLRFQDVYDRVQLQPDRSFRPAADTDNPDNGMAGEPGVPSGAARGSGV